MVMIEKRHLLADEFERGFIEPGIKGYGPVPGDTTQGAFAEVVVKILGRLTKQMDMAEITDQGRFSGRGVNGRMVVVVDPLRQIAVKHAKRHPFGRQAEELFAYGF